MHPPQNSIVGMHHKGIQAQRWKCPRKSTSWLQFLGQSYPGWWITTRVPNLSICSSISHFEFSNFRKVFTVIDCPSCQMHTQTKNDPNLEANCQQLQFCRTNSANEIPNKSWHKLEHKNPWRKVWSWPTNFEEEACRSEAGTLQGKGKPAAQQKMASRWQFRAKMRSIWEKQGVHSWKQHVAAMYGRPSLENA